MISGTLNVVDCCKAFSHGRVSGCYAENLLFNCGVMDGRAEEESPVKAGLDYSDCKFGNAMQIAAE